MMHSKGSSIPYDLSYTIVSLVYVLIKCTREKKPFYNNHHRIRNRKQLCHVETIVHARMTSLIVQMDCLHDNILSQDSRCVYTYFANGMSPSPLLPPQLTFSLVPNHRTLVSGSRLAYSVPFYCRHYNQSIRHSKVAQETW